MEAIAKPGAYVGPDDMNEYNQFIQENFCGPYAILVNAINDYGIDFESLLVAGNSPLEKKVAILTYRPSTEKSLNSVKDAQNMNFPDKQIHFFYQRDEAIEWLTDI